jgi:hypothetical protein
MSNIKKNSKMFDMLDIKNMLDEIEVAKPKKIITEDTGKMFEMAICLAYGIEFDGKYKYDMDLPKLLQNRLIKLPELFPKCKHTAKRGSRYDFTAIDDETLHLSAKTIKKGSGKVAPQVIGQAQPKKFCEEIGIEFTTISDLKKYIQQNITLILPYLVKYTFDSPNLYYHQKDNKIMYIEMIKDIEWDRMTFEWTKLDEEWKNSSTLKIKSSRGFISLVEFQFHTASRTNMAIRWCYDNVLDIFRDNFKITEL